MVHLVVEYCTYSLVKSPKNKKMSFLSWLCHFPPSFRRDGSWWDGQVLCRAFFPQPHVLPDKKIHKKIQAHLQVAERRTSGIIEESSCSFPRPHCCGGMVGPPPRCSESHRHRGAAWHRRRCRRRRRRRPTAPGDGSDATIPPPPVVPPSSAPSPRHPTPPLQRCPPRSSSSGCATPPALP